MPQVSEVDRVDEGAWRIGKGAEVNEVHEADRRLGNVAEIDKFSSLCRRALLRMHKVFVFMSLSTTYASKFPCNV